MGIPYDKSQSSPWFYAKIALLLPFALAYEWCRPRWFRLFPPAKPIETPWDQRYRADATKSSTEASKQDALFLNLPLEVRHAVYQLILPAQTFHLSLSIYGGVPVSKFKCLHPQFHADSVHGDCHGYRVKQDALDLLSLPLVCRQTRDEALPILYQNTWLTFSQPFCFLSVFDALPPDLTTSIRHASYHRSIDMKLIRAQPVAMEEWHRFCAFWPKHFSPSFNLHLSASPFRDGARRIRHPQHESDVDWLRPLLSLARRIQLWLQIPSGDSGAHQRHAENRFARSSTVGTLPPGPPGLATPAPLEAFAAADFFRAGGTRETRIEQQRDTMNVVIDLSHMVEADRAEEELVADLQRQVQDALWKWKPYGRLIGDD
ncbi:uncharacterized protein AB675_2321 [Cyphellophora attinorum]|uniref:DUF7730 domain-containing protein n=1 Tax=Cyphellophora attinorum TaxID=1664694 RepID=A0A0N1HAM6_9EURO|nr:uncharacterized protein AB675_2321 [Phialophora attinorum]KPI45064.1 hypothetical protein AB675_2321 [Phialophora attinorum]